MALLIVSNLSAERKHHVVHIPEANPPSPQPGDETTHHVNECDYQLHLVFAGKIGRWMKINISDIYVCRCLRPPHDLSRLSTILLVAKIDCSRISEVWIRNASFSPDTICCWYIDLSVNFLCLDQYRVVIYIYIYIWNLPHHWLYNVWFSPSPFSHPSV